jgi:imidazolonepropionase-like amidohydrolase
MNRIVLYLAPAFLLAAAPVLAQETFPYNGVRPKEVTTQAFTNATLWLDADTRIDNATLVVEKGRVKAAGASVAVPKDAVVTDLQGKWIYPSFIDLFSDYGMPKAPAADRPWSPRVQMESDRKGAFGWNQAIRSDVSAAALYEPQSEAAKELRGIGIGVVLSHQMDGIARGSAALIAAGDQPQKALLRTKAAAVYSFSKGSSTQQYPSSLMGSIALLRQTYYDVQWYAAGGQQLERNLSLDAWLELQSLPQIFDAGDKWNSLRADRIGDEFKVQYILKGSGNEYQRLDEIRNTGAAFILPLDFPAPWNVSDPYSTRMISLGEMKHWELAPYNALRLHQAGVTVAFTAHGLQDKKQFISALRKVRETGMSEQDILRALTLTPAKLMRAGDELGMLRPGAWANFFIASGNLFSGESSIYDHYIQGDLYEAGPQPDASLAGIYSLTLNSTAGSLEVKGDAGSYSAELLQVIARSGEKETDDKAAPADSVRRKVSIEQFDAQLTLVIEPDSAKRFSRTRLSGVISGNQWKGRGQDASGLWMDWAASVVSAAESKDKKEEKTTAPDTPGDVIFPFTSYGYKEKPKQETVHIMHATLWTNEQEGVIEDGQLIIHNGKIVAVGKQLNASAWPGAKVVDARGRHVTPGIIDEHSHIALNSVNEGTQTSSAEVQEATVVDPEDIDIYRQLSGGVTAAQLLHGSANPIGGQSALVKMRWGATDQGMLIEGADGFIKFALGENVKQSNWGDYNRVRYPQTRMGVEQVYYDHFIRAREYGAEWAAYKRASSAKGKKAAPAGLAPRRDLELDCLLEILEKKRFVTCHSYQQGEINMLMHVADSMGFRLNTFTHILEGYKVADKMKAHGAGASSFSDWWAYKVEVKDAIPHNGALLWENGITVAFNSDDAEMARRLNQEAAKAVKYGGVPEQEALKFVTLNPAKLLHLDHRMGSLKVGKDADIVLWSDHPLSVYAKSDMTFVDGICYFDAEKDKAMREEIARERARLIEKMAAAKLGGGPGRDPAMKGKRYFHCDSLGDR